VDQLMSRVAVALLDSICHWGETFPTIYCTGFVDYGAGIHMQRIFAPVGNLGVERKDLSPAPLCLRKLGSRSR
jgi:hypothetical protein